MNLFPVYFKEKYLALQNHHNLIIEEGEDYFFPAVRSPTEIISIPNSPFGSVFLKSKKKPSAEILSSIQENLRFQSKSSLSIKHPSPIYQAFIDFQDLEAGGFNPLFSDINQHIILDKNWETHIHQMQKRKLHALQKDGFYFEKMSANDLKKAHDFLTICRQAQGLQINIGFEKLQALFDAFPEAYDCFGVFRDGKMSAVCICVRVNDQIAYYYLPGTSPMFRSQSPMVLLIAGMVSFYREEGMQAFDLGISSINGAPQETLRLFKNRMGAKETEKVTFIKHFEK